MYLERYKPESDFPNVNFKISLKGYYEQLNIGDDKLSPLDFETAFEMGNFNPDANAGPYFASKGFRRKGEVVDKVYNSAKDIYSNIVIKHTKHKYKFRTHLAGRPKLMTYHKALKKVLDRRSLGRGVTAMDAVESVLTSIYSIPVFNKLKNNIFPAALGFKKTNLEDCERLYDHFSLCNIFINCDFTEFDANTSARLIRRAFGLLQHFFDGNITKGERMLLMNICDNFVNTYYITKSGEVCSKESGIPSGSGLTSIIATLIHHILVCEAKASINLPKGVEWVASIYYGDDGNYGFYYDADDKARYEMGKRLNKILAVFYLNTFGMKYDVKGAFIGLEFCVSCVTPNIPTTLRDKSSLFMKDYFKKIEIEKGRPLEYDEKFLQLKDEPKDEYLGGTTHRWAYKFRHTFRFLQFHFKSNLRPIRPTYDVFLRLMHPEGKVGSLDEQLASLKSALFENVFNSHTVNRLMHLYIDIKMMRRYGITNQNLAKIDYYDRMAQEDYARGATVTGAAVNQPFRAHYRKESRIFDLNSDNLVSYDVQEYSLLVKRFKLRYSHTRKPITNNYVSDFDKCQNKFISGFLRSSDPESYISNWSFMRPHKRRKYAR
jgi:hypothetical protein